MATSSMPFIRSAIKETQLTVIIAVGSFLFGGLFTHTVDLIAHREHEAAQYAVTQEKLTKLQADIAEVHTGLNDVKVSVGLSACVGPAVPSRK